MSVTDIVTMTSTAQRAESFRFDVLNPSLELLGTIDVDADSGSVENNINRTIKRQLNDLELPPSDRNAINPLADWIKPWMVMQDGSSFPLGVFIFQDYSRVPMTGNRDWVTATLLDQSITLDQGVHRAYGFKPGTVISTAIERLLVQGQVTSFEVDLSPARVRGSEWVVWQAGTSLLEIINDLCQMASYYTLYFDNEGVARVRQVPDLATTEPTLRYGTEPGEQRVYDRTIVESDDLLTAPNRYIVTNTGMTDDPVVGYWDVPSTAPNSFQNIGRIIASVTDKQGIDTTAEANAAAKAIGQADFNTYSWATFDAVPDPRHDTFDIVAWDGVNYREQSWTLPLRPGASHRHELRRIWGEPDFIEVPSE